MTFQFGAKERRYANVWLLALLGVSQLPVLKDTFAGFYAFDLSITTIGTVLGAAALAMAYLVWQGEA